MHVKTGYVIFLTQFRNTQMLPNGYIIVSQHQYLFQVLIEINIDAETQWQNTFSNVFFVWKILYLDPSIT